MRTRKSHNYKITMERPGGGRFTITRNAVSPSQAMRYADTEFEKSKIDAKAVRAWLFKQEPDPRDWVTA